LVAIFFNRSVAGGSFPDQQTESIPINQYPKNSRRSTKIAILPGFPTTFGVSAGD
jgi:hypothetical protein